MEASCCPLQLLAEAGGMTCHAAAWAGGRFALPAQASHEPFACLIWDHGSRISADEQLAISRVLVDAGCRYGVCGGHDCEGWHDAMDHAAAIRDLDRGEGPLVMTTWHEGEPLADVAWFFLNLTDFEDLQFRGFLILHIGTGPERTALDAAVVNLSLHKAQAPEDTRDGI